MRDGVNVNGLERRARRASSRGVLVLVLGCLIGGGAIVPSRGMAEHAVCRAYEAGAKHEVVLARIRAEEDALAVPCLPLYRGLIERETGNWPAAASVFSRGIEVFPRHIALRLELAVTLSWMTRLEEALEQYRFVLNQEPTSRGARLGEARVLAWHGELAASRERYQRLLDEDVHDVEALNGLALVARSRLRARNARLLYERVLALDEDNVEAKEGLAALRALNRWRLDLDTGRQVASRNGRVASSAARIRYQRRSRSFFALGYRRDARVLQDPVGSGIAGVDVLADSLQAQFSGALSRRWTGAVTGELRDSEHAGRERYLSIDVARTSNPRLTWLAGVRGGNVDHQGTNTLAYVGFSAQPGPVGRHGITVQLFQATATGRSDVWALSTQGRSEIGRRTTLNVGGSVGTDRDNSFVSAWVEVTVRVRPGVHLRGRHDRYEGTFSRDALNVGVTFQF